ncbi:Short-chain dehydrogenase/reductase SDR [Corchorus olitorius]|uniref:Short-chain dehydrogenase/reductase SDR n=1 Tax=Corchorus olitorius TaxID=93759 RepID=A0A1R3HDT3_9ROSI|nr:Short-chain dehydrogenase/reductase SDR [Corchorus olitorius]
MDSNSLKASNIRRLEGKAALITGGASGIGESTARLFVRHGAKVLIADIQDELGNSICQQLGTQETISYVHCDVTSDSDVRNAVDLAVSKYGKLDIMFNNAGVGNAEASVVDADIENFKKVVDINLFGGFLGAKHAARVMIPAKKGCILFTASVSSVLGGAVGYSYAASKHALVGLAKSLCVELGQHGIRVNCISPFVLATPLSREVFMGMEKEKLESVAYKAGNLKGKVLDSEDVAEAVLYLASDESKYVSGINLLIDGGYSITNASLPMTIQSLMSS